MYPDTSLARAGERRDDARKLLARGVDPFAKRQADKRARKLAVDGSFEYVAREAYSKQTKAWTAQSR